MREGTRPVSVEMNNRGVFFLVTGVVTQGSLSFDVRQLTAEPIDSRVPIGIGFQFDNTNPGLHSAVPTSRASYTETALGFSFPSAASAAMFLKGQFQESKWRNGNHDNGVINVVPQLGQLVILKFVKTNDPLNEKATFQFSSMSYNSLADTIQTAAQMGPLSGEVAAVLRS